MTRRAPKSGALPVLKGISPEVMSSLRLILSLKPWEPRGIGGKVGRLLDGDRDALKGAPLLRKKVLRAARTVRKAAVK